MAVKSYCAVVSSSLSHEYPDNIHDNVNINYDVLYNLNIN